MKAYRTAFAAIAVLAAIGGWVVVGAGQQPPSPQLPGAPLGSRGEAIYPALEGWGPLKDGQNAILVGYYNRNREQALDIPIGPNNRIEPGGPDMGQPTHFEAGRAWGVFAIQVPKDFGTKKLTWTLVANGQTAQVQFWLNPPYWVDFYKHGGNGNTPPVVKFAEDGAELVGPPHGFAETLTASVNQPLTLKLWVKDAPPTENRTPAPTGTAARGRGAAGRGNADANGSGAPAAAAARRARGGDQNFDVSAARGGFQSRGDFGRGSGPRPDVTVSWKRHRGPADFKVADETIRLFNGGDVSKWMEATTTATFTTPGEYVLRAQVNDQSGDGGGGEQCCWTDAHVKVTVK
jgi:hypothetical protein